MHNHNIHSLSSPLPRGKPLFYFSPINILEIFKDFSPTTRKYSKIFHQHPKIFKDFFVLVANLNYIPEIFKHLLGNKQPAATINSSNQQQQPAAAISSSNQQQLSTAAINSSNQQQQSTAAINSSSQQQQSTASISSSNQQHLHNPRRLPLVTNTVPSRSYVLLEVDLGLAARL